MKLKLAQIVKQLPKYGKHIINWSKANSNWLLSAFAALGVALTVEEAVRATIKAVKVCEEKQIKNGKEVIRTVWKLYIPAVGFFLLTTISICGNAHINAKRFATAAELVALSRAEKVAIVDKAKEMFGEKKVEKLEDEVERDIVDKNPPPPESEIVKTGHGNDLFRDYLTGQYFRACPAFIQMVEEKLNSSFGKDIDGIVQAGYYLDLLGLDRDCYISDALWDYAEMRNHGDKEIRLDATTCKWMEVNGKQEMVSTVHPIPLPTGI